MTSTPRLPSVTDSKVCCEKCNPTGLNGHCFNPLCTCHPKVSQTSISQKIEEKMKEFDKKFAQGFFQYEEIDRDFVKKFLHSALIEIHNSAIEEAIVCLPSKRNVAIKETWEEKDTSLIADVAFKSALDQSRTAIQSLKINNG